ncbi:hypothetical protein V7S76_13265, partial [Aquirufa sp. ROCK2-A2]
VFTQVNPGIYSITIKSQAGCVSTATTDTVNAQPNTPATPIVTITQPTCNVSTGTITVAASGINTDQYSIDGTNYQSGRVFTQVNPGIYSITIKSITGCVSTATTDTVNAQPNTPTRPIISSSGSTVCAGTSISLTSSSATGNQWYRNGSAIIGANAQEFVTNQSGNYEVEYTNNAGCTSAKSLAEQVVVNAIPSANIAQGSALGFSNCGTSSILLSAQTSASSPSYQWYKDGQSISNATSSSYSASQAGNYSVLISENGCSHESSITKILPPANIN